MTQPLRGTLVIDTSRMLPGAVLARTLLDLGARVIKVEAPGTGDPMRLLPPSLDGVGAGFCAFFRGAESICLDLKTPAGIAALRALAARADVMIESFRPGTLESWGAGPERLSRDSPKLVLCSLTAFGTRGEQAHQVGHDVNLVAETGLLERLSGDDLPRIQIADVTAGLLAGSAILAALLVARQTGQGMHIDQPLASGPMPFLTLAMAEATAGGFSAADLMLSGQCPAYRLYRCGDGRRIAVGALEPKFWAELVDLLGLPEAARSGLDPGPAGQQVAREIEAKLSTQPRQHWLDLARKRDLPVSAVNDLQEAAQDAVLRDAGLIEDTPTPGGATLRSTGPYVPSLGATPSAPAPRLGEHTERVLAEFGVEDPS